MKKLALIIIALFTTTIVDANTYYSIANWKSNQNPNGKWSTSPNGASCNCGPNFSTDTVYISNNVTLYNGVSVNTGAIIVENGGRLTIGDWGGSTDFGANAYVEIQNGGVLVNYYALTNAGQFTVNGTYDMRNGSSITNSGSINVGSSATFKTKDYTTLNNSGTFNTANGSSVTIYTITNSGSMYLDSDINARDWNTISNSGSFTVGPNADIQYGNITNDANSTMTVYGNISNKSNWNTVTNNGNLTVYGNVDASNLYNNSVVNGTGIVDYGTSAQNNGTINGSSTSVFTSPTYLANVPNGNYKIYSDGNWVTGAPSSTLDAIFLSDYSENTNVVAHNIKVNPTVTVNINDNRSWSVSGSIENNGTIIVEQNGNLVQSGNATNTGNGTYIVKQRGTTSPYEYNKWSSPVPHAKIAEVFHDENLYDLFAFDAATQAYKYDYTGTETNSHASSPFSFNGNIFISGADGYFDVGRGYFAAGANSIREFSDNDVNNGTYYVDVETSNVSTPSSWGGNDWNMIGNPYPSSISTDDFLQANYNGGNGIIANAVYYWDAPNNQYIVKNTTDNDLIGKGQGFWVAALSPGQVVFSNSMRSTTNQVLRSSNSLEGLYINLTSPSELKEQVRVYLDENASDEEDNVYDAIKLENGSGFNFYSDINGVNYSFQSLDTLEVNETKTIAVGFTAHETGMYLFEVDSMLNLDNYSVFIEDLEYNNLVDLHTKGNYYVQVDSVGTYNNRFLIHLTRNEAVADTTTPADSTGVINSVDNINNRELTATVYKNAAQDIVVKFNAENDVYNAAYVYDINGRMIETQTLQTGSTQSSFSAANLSTGVYIIRLAGKDGQTKSIKFMNN